MSHRKHQTRKQFKPTKKHKPALQQSSSYYDFIRGIEAQPDTERFNYIKAQPQKQVLEHLGNLGCLILTHRLLYKKKPSSELCHYLNRLVGFDADFVQKALYQKGAYNQLMQVRATEDERNLLRSFLAEEVQEIDPAKLSIKQLRELYDNGDCVANDLAVLPEWMQRDYLVKFIELTGSRQFYFHNLFNTTYQIDEVVNTLVRQNDKRLFLQALVDYRDLDKNLNLHVTVKLEDLKKLEQHGEVDSPLSSKVLTYYSRSKKHETETDSTAEVETGHQAARQAASV